MHRRSESLRSLYYPRKWCLVTRRWLRGRQANRARQAKEPLRDPYTLREEISACYIMLPVPILINVPGLRSSTILIGVRLDAILVWDCLHVIHRRRRFGVLTNAGTERRKLQEAQRNSNDIKWYIPPCMQVQNPKRASIIALQSKRLHIYTFPGC